MPHVFASPAALKDAVGQSLGPSDWITIDQPRIDKFADATDDHQWIHVDAERAKTGPFGATIAHGYLTLSLVAPLLGELFEVEHVAMALNYGLEKVRFPAAVRAGSRVRGHGQLVSADEVGTSGVQAVIRVTIEIEGGDKPACVADAIVRFFPGRSR
jgi:acyl dehydratase